MLVQTYEGKTITEWALIAKDLESRLAQAHAQAATRGLVQRLEELSRKLGDRRLAGLPAPDGHEVDAELIREGLL